MDRTLQPLSHAAFALLCVCVLTAPWLFGAWEVWWFWPMVAGLFGAGFLLGARIVIESCLAQHGAPSPRHSRRNGRLGAWPAFLWLAPFLVYLFVRYLQSDVRMDAERVFLLFFTACLVAAVVIVAGGRRKALWLHGLILADLCLLGLYGVCNHAATGSRTVLGVPGYPQYFNDGRASGTYFCPDHFSGLMELALCLSLPWLGARAAPRPQRLLAALATPIALAGIYLSKSRGGGLTVAVILGAWWLWGFLNQPPRLRWLWRSALVAAALLMLGGLCFFGRSYVTRFVHYFGWTERAGSLQRSAPVADVLMSHDRPQMMAAALRAWRDAPWFGIGPGMHQNYWPHYAATPDGDRATGQWPRFPNHHYHSDYVHSDWIQLLEETGVVGLALFLAAAGFFLFHWLRCLYKDERLTPGPEPQAGPERYALVCGAVLSCAAMGFHSLGDFNLQIPATTWLFAASLAIAWSHCDKGSWKKNANCRHVG